MRRLLVGTSKKASAAFRFALGVGMNDDHPPDFAKRIRLCNGVCVLGLVIMAAWACFEIFMGDPTNLKWELSLGLAFSAGLVLNGAQAYRAARLLSIVVANATVLAGAVMFPKGSGGTLPFFAMMGLPLLLFSPSEAVFLAFGIAVPVLLFAGCETGTVAWLGITPKQAPWWYFGANAATTFVATFLLPLFFYRANRRNEAELERSGHEKLKRIIDSSIIGVARGRLGEPITEANDALLDMLGYTRSELEAGVLDLDLLTPTEHTGRSCRAMNLLMERGVSPAYETEYLRKDGTRLPVLVGMALLDARKLEVVGFVLDMTAQKLRQRQNELVRESQEAVRIRERFNSIASHELRTPLAALTLQIGRAHQLLKKGRSDRTAILALIGRCETSARKMGQLIDTLMDATRIQRGRLELSLREMDLVGAARAVAGGLETGALCRPRQIVIKATAPVWGKWDLVRIEQVITNLLSNAIKYGGGKPIEVRITRDPQRKCAHLEVADQGMGIEPGMLDRIFDPFQRAVSDGQAIQGLGLGLFVVRSIVEAHGGGIRVESQHGAGTRFVVELSCDPMRVDRPPSEDARSLL